MGIFNLIFGNKSKGTGGCPACNEPMKHEKYEGVEIDRCSICQGTWLDDGELDTIVARREQAIDSKLAVKMKVLKEWKVSAGEANSPRLCPRCGSALRTVNYKQVPGLQIEKCARNCGLWLDHKELEKVQAYEESR